jgi:hypothetical protein
LRVIIASFRGKAEKLNAEAQRKGGKEGLTISPFLTLSFKPSNRVFNMGISLALLLYYS